MDIKTDSVTFARDTSNGALLNTDTEGLQMYKARRAQRKRSIELDERVEHLEMKIQSLESKLDIIINLLKD